MIFRTEWGLIIADFSVIVNREQNLWTTCQCACDTTLLTG